jgi:hypothetical protein
MRRIAINARMAVGLLAIGTSLIVTPGAFAAASPLLLAAPADGFSSDGSLTITTNAMPKGWFSSANTFDRTKSEIRLSIDISASDCSSEVTLNKTSLTDGAFSPVLNSQGKTTAYTWTITLDLSGYRDHWHNLIHCGGSVEVVGCREPRVVTVSATAYDSNGACHDYTNDAGQTVCASDGKSGLLTSVQDPDQFETCAPVSGCDIGSCVSSCQTSGCGDASKCASGQPGAACRNAITACRQCCECVCKSQTAGCTPQDLCYTGSPGHPQCLTTD